MDLLIFDLDGTLIDSRLDLADSVNATRRYMDLGPIDNDLVFSYVGNGAPVLMRRALGPEASDTDVARALDYFIRYYSQHCLDHTALYPGVREALDLFRERGARMAVLTNKPVRISGQIVRGLGLGDHFFRIYGGNSFEQKKPHPVGIDTLRAEAQTSQSDTWMIGDSWVDIQTARNAGVPSCGVTWGFQPESLRNTPPDVLVDRIEDFAQRFL